MRKATFLLLLLLMAVGAGATVITDAPVAGKQYKIKCIATDHTGYLGDDGTTLQGRHATGTFFELVSNGTEGQYYLKSVVTGKYINAEATTSGSAISFDEAATTYWTIDQTNANTEKYSWAIRPNGTDGVSLNNNGDASSTCPYMKVNEHNSNTQGCDLWTFDDGEVAMYEKPAFGGTVWTWNTSTSVFDADGQESTATPTRADNKGPVYKFVNVGTVTTAVNTSTDTSDSGGIWVIGSSSKVTSSLGRWAGSVLVEDNASAIINYSNSLKGAEAEGKATVWTNGSLTITGRTNFDMNDGNAQRWYIGENGVINTSFTSVTRGSRLWDLQVVVADEPERTGVERQSKTLKKKVMTWGADISSNINSTTVWYKNAEGTLTKLDNSAVSYDATGITITYTGLGYDEQTPVLPEGQYIIVGATKANFFTPATAADDNEHWYVMTQTRGGETPMYDNGANQIQRAAVGTSANGQTIAGNEKYLVRFFETSTGVYDMQFATGNYITASLTTGQRAMAGSFKLYNINDEATHIGWNLSSGDGYGSIVDNNGAGSTVVFYSSGQITTSGNNNDWSIYPVEFVEGVTVNYTIHSTDLDEDYTGSYVTGWADANTLLPELAGVAGYTLTDTNFSSDSEGYKLAANITFPFPVSNASVSNATGIESALGNSKWFVNEEGNIKANNAANTSLTYSNQDDFKWYIYPTFSAGAFTFKIKHNTNKFIPVISDAQGANTTNAVVEDEASAGAYQFLPCTGTGKGFSMNGTVFLTVNTSGTDQNIWGWTKNGSHQGSNLSFPNVTITVEDVTNQFNTLKGTEKFSILEGSTVQGPSEFASPTEINAAIDAAQAVSTSDMDAMLAFIASDNGQKIQNYLNQKATYGALYNYQFTVAYPYSTIILPCPSTRPSGITIYSCSGVEENGTTLTLTAAGNFAQNTPYIMESTVGNKYTIIGWDKGSRATHVGGWLTGVLTEGGATIPENSYVLALNKTTGTQAFYKTDG
ncbi:MAG: hypothetical protein ACI3YD_04965, partial [Alloprevotella sp.]